MNNKHEAEIMKLMRDKFPRFPIFDVFRDFVSWVTLSIRQPLEWQNAEGIENRMQELCRKYNEKERRTMTEMYALLVEAMEYAVRFGEYADILSRIFQGLEIHSKTAGQFFTPWSVAYASARIAFEPERAKREIAEKGYISAYEPTVGGGTMILALAQVMQEAGFEPQKHLLIYATDIDYRCACMAYIHTSLYCLPGVIRHGNELSQEIFGTWFTPIYVFDLWIARDRFLRGHRDGAKTENAGGAEETPARAGGAEQERIREEIRQLSSNWLCRVCHKASMTQAVCRRYGGSICMKHCKECEYHQPMFWHCLYKTKGAARNEAMESHLHSCGKG